MEISNEIKAKVFAQYLGCQFKWSKEKDEEYIPILSAVNIGEIVFSEEGDDSGEGCYSVDECKLILRPLSQITGEDAVEVAKLSFHQEVKDVVYSPNSKIIYCKVRVGDEFLEKKIDLNALITLPVGQFLQLQGYDLPHYLLGNKTLHDCGLAVYESPERKSNS